jgi:hopene-associated glycosyltransferase HpnB
VSLSLALTVLGAASLTAWLALLALPARPWDLQPIAEDEPPPQEPHSWPAVCAIVPARDEAELLPLTLPSLLAQEYPGALRVVVVDDRSADATAEVASALGREHVTVVRGGPLPDGWAGKVWALEQGRRAAGTPEYLLATDADIRHAPGSLRLLVTESEAAGLALNSRMARLRSGGLAARLLIPPFLFFFNVLYPMRRVNDPCDRLAAAAGGCMLIRRECLESASGFEEIRGEIIDDVNLAKAIKGAGEPIRLAVSRTDVVSLREYGSVGAVWRMVSRSAFDELDYSWLRLAGTLLGLGLLFAVPPCLVALSLAGIPSDSGWRLASGLLGGCAWGVMAGVFLRTVRYFELFPGWAITFPLGGLLYGGMTMHSALRHATGRSRLW